MKRLPRAAVALAIAAASTLGAQADTSHAVPRGALLFRVSDTASAPLEGAEIVLPVLDVKFAVPDGGSLLLEHVRPGNYLVQARRLGYAPETRMLHVESDTVFVPFFLERSATELDTVNVSARVGFGWSSDFERRRKLGLGTYLARSDLENVARLSGAFRNIAGVRVTPVMGSGADRITLARSAGRPCPSGMLIFVDGMLMNAQSAAGVARATLQPGAISSDPRSSQNNPPAGSGSSGSGASPPTGGSSTGTGSTSGTGGSSSGGSRPLPPTARTINQSIASGTATLPGSPNSSGGAAAPFDINTIGMSTVAAIEVYTNVASIPAEYRVPGSECGVILIWTSGA